MADNRFLSQEEDRFGFAKRFSVCSDEELIAALNKEVGKVGRMNDRTDFLYHLQRELLFREFDCSGIINGRTLNLTHGVRLVDNKLVE